MPKTTTEFKLPELGENIDTAEVIRVLISQGDAIEAEQNVAELETEKAVFELPCPYAGKIAEVRIKEGDSIAVGDVVLTVEESEEASEGEAAEVPAEKEAAEEGERAEVAEEEQVSQAEETEDEKAESAEQPKERKPSRPPAAEEPGPVKQREDGRPAATDGKRIPAPAAPATRRLARELGVDLHQLSGSGPGGRITREDVKAFARQSISEEPGGLVVSSETPSLPDFAQWGPLEREPLSKIAKTTAENLARSWRLIPHVTQHDLANITDLEARRKEYLQTVGEGGPKITVTALAVKAVVAALKEYPHVNSSLDADSGELIVKR
jgi:pyruvate dehydrogenase E2 component (dihydrolipoamide acetyltransferase)